MHPGIRDIAQKWLKDEEREESLERILKFFIEFLREHLDFHLLNAVDPYWPDIVELLEDKTVRKDFGELYAELVAWLGGYFDLRGLWDYALKQLDSAVRVAHDPKIKSSILWWTANIHRDRGEYEEAMELYKKSLEIKEKIGDLKGKSATYHEMANIHSVRGEYEKAMELYRKSLEIIEKIGDLKGKALTLVMLGQLLVEHGDDEDRAQGLAHIMEGFVILKKKLGAADAKDAFEIIKTEVSKVPKSTYENALSMLRNEERRIVEKALRG